MAIRLLGQWLSSPFFHNFDNFFIKDRRQATLFRRSRVSSLYQTFITRRTLILECRVSEETPSIAFRHSGAKP